MARAKTSDRVKDWERQRRQADAMRKADRPAGTEVGDRLREVYQGRTVSFAAVLPGAGVDGTDRVVACGPVMAQQAESLRRIFEADGYVVT